MKYLTSTFVNTLENKVERQIAFTLKILQNLSEEQLTKKPSAGGWSILEILDHLNSYGDYYLPLISSAIKASPEERHLFFKSGLLGNYFVQMINPLTGTKSIGAAKRHLPRVAKKPDQVVYEFIRQEELLLQSLFSARSINLEHARIPVSIAKIIRLKLGDVFLFVIHHIDRHLLQASKLLEEKEGYTVAE